MPKIEKSFYFIRHGQTDWNLEHRIQGHTDTKLNIVGREQASLAKDKIASLGIEYIVSSPLKRALETAEIIGDSLGLRVQIDGSLKERFCGSFEGKLHDEVKKEFKILEDSPAVTWRKLPSDAEGWDDTKKRISETIKNNLKAIDGSVLFVSHGGVFQALQEELLGEKVRSQNAVPYKFSCVDGKWSMDVLND